MIAAHGALWAGGYFQSGMRLGEVLSWQYAGRRELRQAQLQRLVDFANVFRDINRRVCIDTFVNFHFTELFGETPEADQFVPPELLSPLNHLHAARRAGRTLLDSERRTVFEAHFRHEQAHVVGPTLQDAVAAFDWPLLRAIALRPPVRFTYFPAGTRLWFHNFASSNERIEHGLAAFELAVRAGWPAVDAALQQYRVLPASFFAAPSDYFSGLRAAVLSGR